MTMKARHLLSILLLMTLPAVLLPARSGKKTAKTIREVAAVRVEASVGNAPLLPYQVWVTYADGTGAWRQVKWTNSLRETEEEEAAMPAGST